MTDITTPADVQLLIERFYTKVRADAVLAPHFQSVDWEHHTPVIINFWRMILLGEQVYMGNPLQKHLHLSLSKKDFDQWLFYFHQTVDENFSGEKAEEAKQRATSIAGVFRFKMGIN